MHDGFKVVNFDLDPSAGHLPAGSGTEVIKRFDEHKSLAYGVDWSYAPSESRDTIIGSCSFYDHTLRLWRG
jgi:diphthamide biosynthesis protein 7